MKQWHTTQYEIGTFQVSGGKKHEKSSTRTTYSMSHVGDFQVSPYRTWSERSSSLILLGRNHCIANLTHLRAPGNLNIIFPRGDLFFSKKLDHRPSDPIRSPRLFHQVFTLRSGSQMPPHRMRFMEVDFHMAFLPASYCLCLNTLTPPYKYWHIYWYT